MAAASADADHANNESEKFATQLIRILNNGTLSLMISIGHKTHLFDIMSNLHKPATVEEIANSTGLNERYVREWLGGMVVGRII